MRPKGPGTDRITPQQYFDDILLQTAVSYYRAFCHITHRADCQYITHHRPTHGEHTKRLLRQALAHDSGLLSQFDREVAPPFPFTRPTTLPAIPLPSQSGVLSIIDKQQAVQTRRRAEPDAVQLVRRGATRNVSKAFLASTGIKLEGVKKH